MKAKLQKILVTGATGFLGAHVVRSLLERRKTVIAAKRRGSDMWRLDEVSGRITTADMELLDPSSIDRVIALAAPDIVIHCAAYGVDYREQDMQTAFDVNVHGSFELFKACTAHRIGRFVHIGSCFEYGDKDHPVREEESLNPTTIYGATKAAASILLLQSAKNLDVELAVLRPFGMWGPLEATCRLVPQVIRACMERKELDLTGCEQVRDYTYVADIADRITDISLCMDFPTNTTLNLGSGQPVVLKDFVLSIARELDGESLMNFKRLPYRTGEMQHLSANTTKERKLLGRLKSTPTSTGVKAMLSEKKL